MSWVLYLASQSGPLMVERTHTHTHTHIVSIFTQPHEVPTTRKLYGRVFRLQEELALGAFAGPDGLDPGTPLRTEVHVMAAVETGPVAHASPVLLGAEVDGDALLLVVPPRQRVDVGQELLGGGERTRRGVGQRSAVVPERPVWLCQVLMPRLDLVDDLVDNGRRHRRHHRRCGRGQVDGRGGAEEGE
ncbi:hypothetical protein CTA2_11603 [Colletotrichum tanaceti]|nr:hypothetical protein CTA2_11603 [Colletotrichum tanaceti]